MKDLSTIASGNGFLDVLMPGSSEPIGLKLEILPPDHSSLKKYMRETRDKHRHLAQRGRPINTTDEEKISREIAVTAVVGWEWTKDKSGEYVGSLGGDHPEFTAALLSDLVEKDWFRVQIDEYLADQRNFFQASQRS